MSVLLICLLLGNDNPLNAKVGRNEVRIYTATIPLVVGHHVVQLQLPERLNRLGYQRVRQKPDEAGTYFWGHQHFWIYRRACTVDGKQHKARLWGLTLKNNGDITAGITHDNKPLRSRHMWIEGQLLAESLTGRRAQRIAFHLKDTPEHIWRVFLAAEDARFFDHIGVDGRSIARSLLANIKSGKVVQGGSTITQQLIKNRDLSPKRSLGRKVSEGTRALAIEARYDKEDILETYLDHLYLGHQDGLAIHGVATAARVYFSKELNKLSLAESALLAGMVHGPNLYGPHKDLDRAKKRRNWVLKRMADLSWAPAGDLERARKTPLTYRMTAPTPEPAPHVTRALQRYLIAAHGDRLDKGRGAVVFTTIDPFLQQHAEKTVASSLAKINRRRKNPLTAALVALDATDGAVLAYVAGDPGRPDDQFDRVQQAQRQPGSAIKPLLLLSAFDGRARDTTLNPASLFNDAPFSLDLPNGRWTPENNDGRYHGVVNLRQALTHSYNIPFAKLGQIVHEGRLKKDLRQLGLNPGDPALPASFALGSMELSLLQLAGAYTVFTSPGRHLRPFMFSRIETARGRKLADRNRRSRRVSRRSSAFIVRDIMKDVVRSGTAKTAAISGYELFGKTGTSSDGRDTWFVGCGGGVITAVWVGRDDHQPLGLSTSQSAIPIWRTFMKEAMPLRPPHQIETPPGIVEAYVEHDSGYRVFGFQKGSRKEIFRRGALPPRKKFWTSQPKLIMM